MKRRREKEKKDFENMLEYEAEQERLKQSRIQKYLEPSKERRQLEDNNEK
jgi:hypothetical protein